MCTIIGAKVDVKNITINELNYISDYIKENISIRGRDGFGLEMIIDNIYDEYYSLREKDLTSFKTAFRRLLRHALKDANEYLTILVQSRAIPETEDDVNLNEYQPIVSSKKKFIVCHNGLIYNDKELAAQYKINIKYDSQIIPELLGINFSKTKNSNTRLTDTLINTYKELQGSFSCIIGICNENKDLFKRSIAFMVNYQPLYYIKGCNFVLLSNIKTNDCSEIEPYSIGFYDLRNKNLVIEELL
jgi:glucosamine 6-phosphate synthetase-like amidotransferase/phosphosugar isomerase protein